MAIQKTECYVLRRVLFRETSWILTCLTRSFGKIRGIAKGVRKEKSPWASSCELMTHANMVFFEKTRSNLHLITELSVIHSNEKLRSSFSALAYAGYFAELLDQLLEDHEPQPAVAVAAYGISCAAMISMRFFLRVRLPAGVEPVRAWCGVDEDFCAPVFM